MNKTIEKGSCCLINFCVKMGWMLQILIRFPNGERRVQSFASTDKIQSIFSFIDSLGMPGIANYRLVSNFPRRVYGVDQIRMTLKDAGLFPKASLFLEPMPIWAHRPTHFFWATQYFRWLYGLNLYFYLQLSVFQLLSLLKIIYLSIWSLACLLADYERKKKTGQCFYLVMSKWLI